MKRHTILLAAATLLVAPLLADAQSDETCIAYMEADAAYEEATEKAEVACEEARISQIQICAKATISCKMNLDPNVCVELVGMSREEEVCSGPQGQACKKALMECIRSEQAAGSRNYINKCSFDSPDVEVKCENEFHCRGYVGRCEDIRDQYCRSSSHLMGDECRRISERAAQACDAAKEPIMDAAGEAWGRAYGDAYDGPTSENQSVFQQLVLADRERCRERGM